MAWPEDSETISIYLNDTLSRIISDIPNTSARNFRKYGPLEFVGGTDSTVIKFMGENLYGRFYLDDVVVGVTPLVQIDTIQPFNAGVNDTTTQSYSLEATNLTDDLIVHVGNIAGNSFSSTISGISHEQAMAGFSIPVVYSPAKEGKDTAIVTISGGGLLEPIVDTITGRSWPTALFPTMIFHESFDEFKGGTISTPLTSRVTDFDQYTQTIGWSGEFVYSAGGIAKIGTSTSKGSITTPFIDISSGDGRFSVSFISKAYSGDITTIDIHVNDSLKKVIPNINFVPYDTLNQYGPYVLNAGTDSIQIKLEGSSPNGRFYLDDFIVSSILFSENFNGFAEGSLLTPTETQVKQSGSVTILDSCTQTMGWNGNRIYQAGGAIKAGASSDVGTVITPPLDLSANNGTFSMSFKAMAWPGDSSMLQIYVNDELSRVINELPNSGLLEFANIGPYDYNGGTDSTRIKIKGTNSNGRFYLDDLIISWDPSSILRQQTIPVNGNDIDKQIENADGKDIYKQEDKPQVYTANGILTIFTSEGQDIEIYNMLGIKIRAH
jgi:hypothetical protein